MPQEIEKVRASSAAILGWIVVAGDPINGFTFYGTFDTSEEAIEWADGAVKNSDWWLGELQNSDSF